ncbi:hypothetical protein AB0O58_11960 [Rhodococcus sp. NPDC080181]|uniref:hypothetical protein n=1 Tax=Rhodococcus sp. NPDC080181 TaxID=3155292 RepID=UPI00344F12D7
MAQNLMAASSGLPSVLVSQQLTAAEVTQYTCPAASAAKLATATVVNTSITATTVALSIVKSGGTAGVANRVATFSLAAGDSSVVTELAGHFLGPGDYVSAIAGAASAVTLVMSGVVFS